MPKRRTAEEIQAKINQLTAQRDAAIAAEKSAKIKAQAQKRGQMLALIGLATIAYLNQANSKTAEETAKYLQFCFKEKYPAENQGQTLSEAQIAKRQRDQNLLKEAIELAKSGQLK